MKHLFVINPAAGKYDHTKEYTEVIDRTMADRGEEYEITLTTAPGDCERIARTAAETGEELRIYACGGDGTLNGIVNGAAGFDNVAVTHFPGGSGNDTIKIFSETEPFHHLKRLLDCEETRLDLIRCNDTYCINILSMGLDARVSDGMGKFKHLPLLSGHGAYTLSLAENLFKGLSRPYTVQLEDEEPVEDEQTLICVCNGRWYGGGFNPVPDAEPDDGLLDVLIVKKVGLLTAAPLISDYKAGLYAKHPDVIRHARCRSLTVGCKEPSVVNVDGESIYTDLAHIEVLPGALRFFYPKGLTFAAQKFTEST